jgi:DNA-directed RNA polymerase specialized sigma24 family protein
VLDHLPRHYDQVLEWKYIAGLSVNEIAQRMSMTTKAAESLLSRAREAFRDGFAELAGGDV